MVEKQRNGHAPEFVIPQESTIDLLIGLKEPDNGMFDGNVIDTDRLNMAEIKSFELLKGAEEITLGQGIFAAKLALSNLRSILNITPNQYRLGVEQVLSMKRSEYMLSVLEKEIKNKPAGIKKKEKEGKNADTDRAFLEDVENNDAFLKNVVDKFDMMMREGDRKAAEEVISDFVRQQLTLAQKGSNAFESLVNHNLRLVRSIANHYQGRGLDSPDLEQEARIGLMTAAYKFDHRRGFKFSTLATWWIKQATLRAVAEKGSAVRVPVRMHEIISKFSNLRDQLEMQEEHPIQLEEFVMQQESNPDRRNLIVNTIRARQDVSLDAPVTDGANETTLKDLIPTEDNLEDQTNENLRRETIKTALGDLMPRERIVIDLRFGLSDGRTKTLEEVGDEFGVSRERIRQIENRALRKLRHPSRSEKLRGLLDS